MKGMKMFCYAFLTAVLAGIVTLITWQMNGWPSPVGQPVTYVSFIAWAGYFLFGANVKGAWLAFCSAFVGALGAILMFVLSIAFGFSPWWAVPLAVVIAVIPLCYMEKIKPVSNVAAIFMGTGIYFSLSAAGAFADFDFSAARYCLIGLTEMLYIFIGFVAGWLTIQINIMCSKMK